MLFWLNMRKYCSLRCFKSPTLVISLLKFKTTVAFQSRNAVRWNICIWALHFTEPMLLKFNINVPTASYYMRKSVQPSKRRETTDYEILISVQKCWYGEICVLSGSSPAGGAVVPGPLIWNRCPPFHVWPTGCCIHPILYIKNVPPFWFMTPPQFLW